MLLTNIAVMVSGTDAVVDQLLLRRHIHGKEQLVADIDTVGDRDPVSRGQLPLGRMVIVKHTAPLAVCDAQRVAYGFNVRSQMLWKRFYKHR